MIYFAYPDVFFSGSPINFNQSKRAVITGRRQGYYEAETAESTFSVVHLSALAPDLCILSDAHTLTYRDDSPLMSITGANDAGFTVSAESFNSNITLAGLKNHGTDHLFEFTPAASKTHWRVRIITSATIDQRIGKLYLCRKLSLGREPTTRSSISYDFNERSGKRPVRRIRLAYDGISSSSYETFKDRILRYKSTNPVFLYAKNNQVIFNGDELIHAICESVSITSRTVERVSFTVNLREIL